jgi:RNA polymerase-binding transcription factor DksA
MKLSKRNSQTSGGLRYQNRTWISQEVSFNASRLAKQRERLLRLGEKLSEEIHQLTTEACEETPTYSMHPADAATDSFDRDLVLGLASFGQEGLYEIEAALKRIEDGTYGVCELTGEPIPWERLEAIPWTRFSLEAEKQLEGNIRPHIGPLGTIQPTEAQGLEEASNGASDRGFEDPFGLGTEEDPYPRIMSLLALGRADEGQVFFPTMHQSKAVHPLKKTASNASRQKPSTATN